MKKKKNIKNKPNNKQKSKKKVTKTIKYEKVKVTKIKYGRIFLVLLILSLIIYLISCYIHFNIKNIFIYNNNILSDQQIIELAEIEDYPSIFYQTKYQIEKKIEKNIYIKKAIVKKKKLKEIHIIVEENYPLFYNSSTSETIFENGEKLNELLNTPILINYVPDKIYELFNKKILEVDKDILYRISEIKYDPNSVDEERFLLTMDDGNYIYITLEKLTNINKYLDIYLDITSKYGNKKGILYLDSGEYFKILD